MNKFDLFLARHPSLQAFFYGLSGVFNPLGISRPRPNSMEQTFGRVEHALTEAERLDRIDDVVDGAERHGHMANEPSFMDGAVELPRQHDLEPRSWRLPNGTIISDTVNEEAVRLLKTDPDEYFRRTRPNRFWNI